MIPSRADIRRFLIEQFNDDELKTLCFDHFDEVYRDFAEGIGVGAKALALVDYCDRRGRLPDLVRVLQQERPGAYRHTFGAGTNVANKSNLQPAICKVKIHRKSQFTSSAIRNFKVIVDGKDTGETLNPGETVTLFLTPGLHTIQIDGTTKLGLNKAYKSEILNLILTDMEICNLEVQPTIFAKILIRRIQ